MDPYVEDLNVKYQHAWERQKEILNRAVAENRDATPEELEDIAKTDEAMDKLHSEQQRYAKRVDLNKAADEMRDKLAPTIERANAASTMADRDKLRAVFNGELRSFDSLPSEMFTRALQAGGGGSAVATTFNDQVMVYLRYETPMLRPDVVTVLNTAQGNPITLPRLTADPSMGGTLVAEAGGITEADPTLSTVTLNAYKYALITLWSSELGEDAAINLEDIVAQSVARELAVDIGVELTTANGSSKPNGIVNAAGNGGTALGTSSSGGATNTFFGPVDLIDLKFTLAAGYRSRGKFMVASTALAKMRKFRDSNGQFLYAPGLVSGEESAFDGNPVIENPAMAAVASATKSVIFGDLSRFWVRRLPQRVDLSTEYKFSTDQVALRVIERVDSDLRDDAAINALINANT
jgi:HK97 family phage major capsid protein